MRKPRNRIQDEKMLLSKIHLNTLKLLPKNTVSRVFGAISEVELPSPVQQALNHSFVTLTGIKAEESARPVGSYRSLNELFTRELTVGARPIEGDERDMVSPVDGEVGTHGEIESGTLLQAKGREYRLVDLVDSAEEAAHFQGGSFATIYLSPRDYHRIHAPVTGVLTKVSYIPGQLFPVHKFAVANIDRLFAINERLITYFNTEHYGRVGLVKVGATCVGRIGLTFDEFETNRGFRRREEITLERPIRFQAGDSLALFNLGSTVILLVESPDFQFNDRITSGHLLRMGQRLNQSRVSQGG